MNDFNATVQLQDTNGNARELVLLKIDAPNGRALVDLDGGFNEHWIPLSILDDSATPAEWLAFEALFEKLDARETARVAPARQSAAVASPSTSPLLDKIRAHSERDAAELRAVPALARTGREATRGQC